MMTRRHLLALALCLALPACVSVRVDRDGNAENALRKLEDDWGRMLVRRDSVGFASLLAPGFVYTEDNQLMSRDEVIRGLLGADTVTSFLNEGLRILVRGNTGVVTGHLTLRGRGASGPFDRRYRFTDTWIRDDGRWRILAAQDYLVPR